MSEQLFDRVVKLTIADNELEGFDCDFEVVRTTEPEPNKCKLKIFNLPEDIRVAAQKADAKLTIKAGYKNTAGQIFNGDIRYAPSAVIGADWVTTIEAGDGEKAYRETDVELTWSKGKNVSSLVDDIVKKFDGILPGNLSKVIKAKLNEQLPRGGGMSGQAMKLLNQLLQGYGYAVSIQDGKFQFLDSTGENQTTAVKLTPDSGLVNEPELGEKDKKTGKAKGKLRSLLQPSIIPGSVVDVEGTSSIKGRFVVQKVTHTGSNYSAPFYTDMEVFVK